MNINSNTCIYVVCPSNNKTGGTELLHQLVFQLNQINGIFKKAIITYYFEGNYDKNNPTPNDFKQYVSEYCLVSDIVDSFENIVIFPEVCIGKHRKYKHIQKIVWWLSVDNFKIMIGRINRLKKWGVKSFIKHLIINDYYSEKDLNRINYHFVQSYFAKDYILNKGIDDKNIYYLSDYINDIYTSTDYCGAKEDIVLYNPKKGFEFTEQLILFAPEINWVPISGMSTQQVFELLHKSKVYIDFGNHPGKDRIPREAAMSGCCIITNRNGSAAFKEDVPIPDTYKFGNDCPIADVICTIKDCIANYDSHINDFYEYREFIKSEKHEFVEDIISIFNSKQNG